MSAETREKKSKTYYPYRMWLGRSKGRLPWLGLVFFLKTIFLTDTAYLISQQRQRWLWSTPPSDSRLMRRTWQRRKVGTYSVWSYIINGRPHGFWIVSQLLMYWCSCAPPFKAYLGFCTDAELKENEALTSYLLKCLENLKQILNF